MQQRRRCAFHLRVAPSGIGGGFIELHLHAVGASTTRVWRIEIDPLRTKKGGTRARENKRATPPDFPSGILHRTRRASMWSFLSTLLRRLIRQIIRSVQLVRFASFSTQRRRSKNRIHFPITSKLKWVARRTNRDRVVRLANFGRDSAPLLVAPSDPRTVKIFRHVADEYGRIRVPTRSEGRILPCFIKVCSVLFDVSEIVIRKTLERNAPYEDASSAA
jgi:hypothetical protein